jgi:hypothetical protein
MGHRPALETIGLPLPVSSHVGPRRGVAIIGMDEMANAAGILRRRQMLLEGQFSNPFHLRTIMEQQTSELTIDSCMRVMPTYEMER